MQTYEPKDNETDDPFLYPGLLYRLMSGAQKQVTVENTMRAMMGVTENVKLRHAAHCYLADPDYGTRLAGALGVDCNKVIELSKLPHLELMKQTMSMPAPEPAMA